MSADNCTQRSKTPKNPSPKNTNHIQQPTYDMWWNPGCTPRVDFLQHVSAILLTQVNNLVKANPQNRNVVLSDTRLSLEKVAMTAAARGRFSSLADFFISVLLAVFDCKDELKTLLIQS